jgi:hypothetical protein
MLDVDSWDDCIETLDDAEAIIECFEDLRSMHASQLHEPVLFTAEDRELLNDCRKLSPRDFAATLLEELHRPLLDRLCGISPKGTVSAATPVHCLSPALHISGLTTQLKVLSANFTQLQTDLESLFETPTIRLRLRRQERRILHAKLCKYYMQHNPAKISDVPVLTAQWLGKEEELFAKLSDIYTPPLMQRLLSDDGLWPGDLCTYGDSEEQHILTEHEMGKLMEVMPQCATVGKVPMLLFSLRHHGASMMMLLHKVQGKGVTLLVIKSESNTHSNTNCSSERSSQPRVYGGYASESWKMSSNYYGTGDSFLFACEDAQCEGSNNESASNSGIDSDSNKSHQSRNVRSFHWTGSNDYVMFSDGGNLSMGLSDSGLGLVVDEDLSRSSLGSSDTYDAIPAHLQYPPGIGYTCVDLEVWGFVV